MKTIGSVCNVILMKSCHKRTKGIEQEECVVSSANAVLLHSYAVAIGFVLYWMTHLQCRVLITHGVVVKVQIGLNVRAERQTNTSLSWKCLSCVHTPHRIG